MRHRRAHRTDLSRTPLLLLLLQLMKAQAGRRQEKWNVRKANDGLQAQQHRGHGIEVERISFTSIEEEI